MIAIEQYFPVVLLIVLYKMALTFASPDVDKILKCAHSNDSYWALLSCGVVCYAVQSGCNFWICGWFSKVWLFNFWSVLSLALFIAQYKVVVL